MNQERIGKFIAELRKSKNMTQTELAQILGVTDRAISNWENGRRLPDYSIIRELCETLDITINDLLNGERVKPKEIEKKFEENILNTINYSDSKIKHTKKKYLIFIVSILLILIAIAICFSIDVDRMRKNQNVIFSTWGLDYNPPINIDSGLIEREIKKYLIKEDEETSHHSNEKSFVSMQTYLITEEQNKIIVYSWILQEKYYLDKDKILKDSGSSIPYKIELSKEEDSYKLINYQIPRDSPNYDKDMKRIFPNSVLKEIDKVHYDGTIEKLHSNIEEQVELYFHKEL